MSQVLGASGFSKTRRGTTSSCSCVVDAKTLARQLEHCSARVRVLLPVVWIDPKQKLRSRVNVGGFKNPTWNDKFVFAVDDKMLENWSTAQLVFEFYYVRRFGKDRLVGTSRVFLGGFENVYKYRYCEEMLGKFRALHVRGPNGGIQEVLNIGLTVLDGLPYQVINGQFMGIASAVDYKKNGRRNWRR
ncbi:hypothetical protein L484_001120 [Morus notabilis]|nr:hypothetical protein L484_001120 [Morus notabilis]